MTDFTNWGHC